MYKHTKNRGLLLNRIRNFGEIEGYVVSWNTLKEEGVSNKTRKEFSACNGKKLFELFKTFSVVRTIYLEITLTISL